MNNIMGMAYFLTCALYATCIYIEVWCAIACLQITLKTTICADEASINVTRRFQMPPGQDTTGNR